MDDLVRLDHKPWIEKTSHQTKIRIKEDIIDILKEDHILIERNDLILKECIGKGNFGCVYKGVLSSNKSESEEVAVKTLENCKFEQRFI